jgi:hypothetical protein
VEEVGLGFFAKSDWLTPIMTLWYELVPYPQKFAKGRQGEMHFIGAGSTATPPPALADYIEAEARVGDHQTASQNESCSETKLSRSVDRDKMYRSGARLL